MTYGGFAAHAHLLLHTVPHYHTHTHAHTFYRPFAVPYALPAFDLHRMAEQAVVVEDSIQYVCAPHVAHYTPPAFTYTAAAHTPLSRQRLLCVARLALVHRLGRHRTRTMNICACLPHRTATTCYSLHGHAPHCTQDNLWWLEWVECSPAM